MFQPLIKEQFREFCFLGTFHVFLSLKSSCKQSEEGKRAAGRKNVLTCLNRNRAEMEKSADNSHHLLNRHNL